MTFLNASTIVFEGVDGCGKTTQIKLLKKHLESIGAKVYCTREPGGSPLAEKIRKLFLGNEEFSPETQILLCSAARLEHINYLEELQKKENFDFIIFDRFIDSTIAYQIYPFNLSRKLFDQIHKSLRLNLKIDITFILDIDPEITISRRRYITDHYDSNTELLQKVRKAYLRIRSECPEKILINSDNYSRYVAKQIVKYVKNIIIKDKIYDSIIGENYD